MTHMTDYRLMKLAHRMESHLEKARLIGKQIEESDHILSGEITDALRDEGMMYSFNVSLVIQDCLDANNNIGAGQ
jgi:hypothetical protein